MFRRRPPRRPMRPRRRGMRRGHRRPPPELVRAHKMMEAGNYHSAATQFEKIARLAEARGGPRAGHLFLQAGRAAILSGSIEAGMAHLEHGLTMMANRSDWPHLNRAGNRIQHELRERGLNTEADQISDFIKATLPGDFSAPQRYTGTKKTVLPTHCPSCGGALRTDEIDWLDEVTAECAYCGSPVRAE